MTDQEKTAEAAKIAADVASFIRARIEAGDEEAPAARETFIGLVMDLNRKGATEEDKDCCREILSLVRYAYLAGKPRQGRVTESMN
jgi:hypothetical protein